ncbi:MAG: hypothetical protein U0W24_12765 [Bacteroidales bacterium]
MKFRNLILISLLIFTSLQFSLHAQEYKQDIVVPLSKPGVSGSLKVNMMSGSIKVEGYSGKEVIVKATSGIAEKDNNDREDPDNNEEDVKGLKKISSNSFDLDIEEKNNEVEISSHDFRYTTDLEIKVPANFSLTLKTVNNGNIQVTNVKGDHEISNINGDIVMSGISGSVVASSINGKIEISFDEITPNKAMSFANMNQKIDLTLPGNTKATLKMNSKMGEIYTDFDVEMVKTDPEVKQSPENNTYRVSISKFITAKLNGGGPEFNFKNFNGNIIVRKKK